MSNEIPFKYEIVDKVGEDDGFVYIDEEIEYPSEIALCTLSAINWGLINDPSDFEDVCELAVRGLDALLDYQEYPLAMAKKATMDRRPLGVGVINFAYFLAKRGLKYDSGALETVHEYAEAWSYYLIKASVELAKEKGPCPKYHETKYARGLFPHNVSKASIDTLIPAKDELHNPAALRMDWASLELEMREHGIRNSTLMALMPAETSAQIANATNGFEPPPELVTKKKSKHGTLAQVVPEIQRLKNMYDFRWDQNMVDYLSVAAVMQKFIDQSGSFNTSHNPEHFEDGEIPISVLAHDVMFAYKYGLKTLYYANPAPTKVDENEEIELEDGPMVDDEECEACVI